MKTAYNYVTLRYVHDPVTEEFANVGVVLFAAEARQLKARFAHRYRRLNNMFLCIDQEHYRSQIRRISDRFEDIAQEIQEGLSSHNSNDLSALVQRVLPKDDSSLQWSSGGGGFTESPETALNQLFERLVERYIEDNERVSRTDEEVGRPFKNTLERKRVASFLEPKRISGTDYEYEFQFAWKNSIWHLYEPVSFDLMDPNRIREKANRWLGRGMALQDANEAFKIYFLLGEPRRDDTRHAFTNARHLLEKIPGNKQLVQEDRLETFSQEVAEEIARHNRTSSDVEDFHP